MNRLVVLATVALLAVMVLAPAAMAQETMMEETTMMGDTMMEETTMMMQGGEKTMMEETVMGDNLPQSGGPAILLPAAALLLGSGVLAFAVLRRR